MKLMKAQLDEKRTEMERVEN